MNNFLQGLMNYHFVQNALISSVLIGAVAGMIGCLSFTWNVVDGRCDFSCGVTRVALSLFSVLTSSLEH